MNGGFSIAMFDYWRVCGMINLLDCDAFFAFVCRGRDALVETPFTESEWSGKAWEAGQPANVSTILSCLLIPWSSEVADWYWDTQLIRYVFFDEMLNHQLQISEPEVVAITVSS